MEYFNSNADGSDRSKDDAISKYEYRRQSLTYTQLSAWRDECFLSKSAISKNQLPTMCKLQFKQYLTYI